MDSMTKQRREGETNGPARAKTVQSKLNKPSWTEFVRLAHQAVVAFVGAGMINRAEPRACGCGLRLNGHGDKVMASETGIRTPEQMRVTGRELNGCQTSADERSPGRRLHFQPCWGKPAARNEWRGWRKRNGWFDDRLPRGPKGRIHWKSFA
jgi:hypothetical protein